MNEAPPSSSIPWIPLGLLAALLSLTPYAMSLPPSERATAHAVESLYAQRVALVIFGLLACVAAVAHLAVTIRRRRMLMAVAPSAAIAVACFVVGWRSFPYWALGVYQVGIGAFPARDQDPKSLMPMTWIGELWRLPILLFQYALIIVAPGLLVATAILLWRRQFLPAVVTAVGASVAAFFFLHSASDYMAWLLD